MKNLRTKFNRFCLRNRDKGIPNLMLYVALGSALVYIMSMFNGGSALYTWLCFDKTSILQGQVWRLFTYVFTQAGDPFLGLLFLYFFYMFGRHVEQSMGTLKFNLFYFSGIILMDVYAMIFSPVIPDVITSQEQLTYLQNTVSVYANMAYYLHLSLILAFSTMYPDSQFLVFFIIPVKAWILALIDLVIVAASIFNLSYPVMYFPHNLFPLVALGNFLLFAGSDIRNLFPFMRRMRRSTAKKPTRTGTIPFRQESAESKHAPAYTHRCTVCGRTDVSNPELEFRYCSRCNGYHCYCEDHINNHSHIE